MCPRCGEVEIDETEKLCLACEGEIIEMNDLAEALDAEKDYDEKLLEGFELLSDEDVDE